ncbi:unnamed protein product, partial [Hymenolepis diminuta]
DIKGDIAINQQNFDKQNYVNQFPSETVSQNVSTLHKILNECWLCNFLYFGPITCYKNVQKEKEESKYHPEIVLAIVIESKPVSRVNAVGKTENGNLPS